MNTARAAIKAAYAAGWIDDEPAWLDLLEMRNASSQTYRESLALDIYRRIHLSAPLLRAVLPKLQEQFP
ncbi:MAG: nucleotidyltransferase substrate binding protein [Rhizomicrobium sp.]